MGALIDVLLFAGSEGLRTRIFEPELVSYLSTRSVQEDFPKDDQAEGHDEVFPCMYLAALIS